MFILNTECKTAKIVEQMYNYMQNEGLKFDTVGLSDSSPYAILNNDTSIGYRIRSKWGMKGIVFFCAADGIDKNNIVEELKLEVYDNSSDDDRPYAIFVPTNQFEKAVEILKKNPANL